LNKGVKSLEQWNGGKMKKPNFAEVLNFRKDIKV